MYVLQLLYLKLKSDVDMILLMLKKQTGVYSKGNQHIFYVVLYTTVHPS